MGVSSRRLRGVRLQLLDFESDAKQIEKLCILGSDKCGKKKWLSMLSSIRRLESPGNEGVVVTFDGSARTRTIAGFVWFSKNSASEAIIRDTWVSPRRRREGLGSDMVLHVVLFLVGSPSLPVPPRRRRSSSGLSGSTRSSSRLSREGSNGYAKGSGAKSAPYGGIDHNTHSVQKLVAYPLQGSSSFWGSLGFVRDPRLPGCLKMEREDLVNLVQSRA